MGIVASAAGDISGVLARYDLREGFRLGGIRLMAGNTEYCGVGKHGFLAGEVLRVASQRAVAGFAADIGMGAFAFSGRDIVMTGAAGLVAGEDGSSRRDFNQGAWAVMSVLAEFRRNEGVADRQERQHENNSD